MRLSIKVFLFFCLTLSASNLRSDTVSFLTATTTVDFDLTGYNYIVDIPSNPPDEDGAGPKITQVMSMIAVQKSDGTYTFNINTYFDRSSTGSVVGGRRTGKILFADAPLGIYMRASGWQNQSGTITNDRVNSRILLSQQIQILSANNLSGSLAVGQSLNGQALGAQNGNLYVITKTGGGSSGSCNINSNTGAYVVTASTIGGPLTFQISVSAGNGFAASNVLSGSVSIVDAIVLDPSAPVKKTTLNFKNPLSEPVRVVAVDSVTGVVYAEATVAPGASVVLQINKTSSNAVTLNYNTVNDTKTTAAMSDGSLRDSIIPAQTYWSDSIPDSGFNTSVFQSPTPTTIKPPASAVVSTTPQTPGQAAPVSPKITAANTGAIGFTTAPAAVGAVVTDATTREGLGAVVTELQAINARGDKQVSDDAKTLADAKSEASNKAASASTSGSLVSSQASGVVPVLSGRASYSSASGSPDLTVSLPQSFGGSSFDLNPFSNSRFAGVCAWFKSACLWLVVLQFAFFAWAEVKTSFALAIVAPQAKGNTIAAGTGGQATALLAAGGITVALLAFFLAVMALFTGDFSLASIASHLGSDPLIGIGSGVLWMIEQLLPVSFIIGAYVFRLVFKVSCLKLVLGLAAVVRFVIP